MVVAVVLLLLVPGTLQQAVVTEALASTLMAPALLYVTRAHATADLTVVAAISLFVVRGRGRAAPLVTPSASSFLPPFVCQQAEQAQKPLLAVSPIQCFCCPWLALHLP